LSEDDKELELLKAKRLAEMQKNLSFKQKQAELESQKLDNKKKKPSHREVVINNLGYRGVEVLENAEYQFPNETKMVVEKLGELISTGELNEKIDGGQLLSLFRSLGLGIRLKTKINVEQDGKFVSLSDKLSLKSDSNPSSD